MKYPFYKHKDIQILYVCMVVFGVLLVMNIFLGFKSAYILSTIGFFFCLILLIGHEILIVLMEGFKLKGYER